MSTALNDRDAILQAASVRIINPKNASILMSASSSLFHLNAAGDVDVPAITISATLIGLEGDVTFTADGAALTSVTGKSAVVRYADMQGPAAIVTARIVAGGQTFAQSCIIGVVRDGSSGSINYTWVKYADSAAGAGLSDDPTGKAYIGLAYNKGAATESTNASDYAWSLIKGTDGQPGGKGADGSTLYTWIKYSRAANGDPLTDLPDDSTMYIGLATNKTTPVESTWAGDYVWSKFRGADGVSMPGTPGARGAGQYYAGGSAWSDGVANAATPGDNVVNDVVTISNGGTYAMTKRWDGSAWNAIGAVFDGSLFATGSIQGAALKAGTVTIYAPDGRVLLGAGGEFGAQVTARNLVVGSPDNVVPDPRFKDLTWWGRPDAAVIQWAESGSTTGWKGGASMLLPTSGPELTRDTIYFDLTPGATYRIEGQAYLSNDFNGRLSAYLLIAGDRWYSIFANDTGQRWADNLAVQLNNTSPKGYSTFSTTYTVPLGAATGRGMIRLRRATRSARQRSAALASPAWPTARWSATACSKRGTSLVTRSTCWLRSWATSCSGRTARCTKGPMPTIPAPASIMAPPAVSRNSSRGLLAAQIFGGVLRKACASIRHR
jgi:hypothetical protein